MKAIFKWLSKVFADALSRAVATFLAGVLLTIAYASISYRLSTFLSQQVLLPVLALLILALFALLGVLYPSVTLWNLVGASRRAKKLPPLTDKRIEAATAELLRLLAVIEAGPDLTYEGETKKFTSEVLAALDAWDIALHPYLSPDDRQAVRNLRGEVAQRSLLHSRQEARDWIVRAKDLGNSARVRIA